MVILLSAPRSPLCGYVIHFVLELGDICGEGLGGVMGVLTSCGDRCAGLRICHPRNVLVWGGGRLVTRADKLCRERGWMDPEGLCGNGPERK